MIAPMVKSQQGVALITAILVVALATTAAVTMISRQDVEVRRTSNILAYSQAAEYINGGERWAARALAADRKDNATDNLEEAWATQLAPVPVPGGTISGFVTDAQARYNLNNVVDGEGKVIPEEIAYVERLLSLIAQDNPEAEIDPSIAHAIGDWIDSDINPAFPGGAEDDVYLALTPAYRTANHAMASISELRLVQGVTSGVYRAIVPYLTALPKKTPINVNTVPAERVALILALDSNIDSSAAEQLIQDAPYDKVDDVRAHDAFSGLEIATDRLSVSSDFFTVHLDARIDRSHIALQSTLERDQNGQCQVRLRSQEI